MNMGHHTVEASAVSEAILVEVFRGTGPEGVEVYPDLVASVASSARATLEAMLPPFQLRLIERVVSNPFAVDRNAPATNCCSTTNRNCLTPTHHPSPLRQR